MLGLGQEVGAFARVEALLTGDACGEELLARGVELALQGDGEGEGLGREDGGVLVGEGGVEFDSGGEGHCRSFKEDVGPSSFAVRV